MNTQHEFSNEVACEHNFEGVLHISFATWHLVSMTHFHIVLNECEVFQFRLNDEPKSVNVYEQFQIET